MHRFFLISLAAVALFAIALAIRLADAPYLAYAQGDVAAAVPGLKQKAEAGDGFAALLVARAHEEGRLGAADRDAAAQWYLAAAHQGELRAVNRFVSIAIGRRAEAASPQEVCETAMALLDLAARAGEENAIVRLGFLYRDGTCVAPDIARAARYFLAASMIDRRYGGFKDEILPRLDSETVRNLHRLPERFDVTREAALAQFVADAPRLLPGG